MDIYINSQDGCGWLYGGSEMWQDYCGAENFDETFVLKGNQSYNKYSDASWYNKANTMLLDLDCFFDFEEWRNIYSELTDQQAGEIYHLYENCKRTDDIIVDVCRILYPEDTFHETTIRGYGQSDWQDVIYKGDADISLLESFYFGKVAEIYNEECSAIVTHDELWDWQRNGTLEKEIRDLLDISDDEEIEIYEADGYVQSIKWKKVG